MAKLLYIPSLEQYFTIEAVTALELHLLFEWLTGISSIVKEHGSEGKAYRTALEEIGKLCRLKFALQELPLTDVSMTLKAIGDLNFPIKESKEKETATTTKVKQSEATWDRFCLELISSVINFGLAPDLQQAIAIAKELPYDRLQTLVEIRYHKLNKTEEKEAKKELAKKHSEDLINGRFFGGGEGQDNSSFFSGMAAAMGANPPRLSDLIGSD